MLYIKKKFLVGYVNKCCKNFIQPTQGNVLLKENRIHLTPHQGDQDNNFLFRIHIMPSARLELFFNMLCIGKFYSYR